MVNTLYTGVRVNQLVTLEAGGEDTLHPSLLVDYPNKTLIYDRTTIVSYL